MSRPPPPLQDRHALVTGGGRGIGAAIATALAEAGARLTLVGRSRDTLAAEAASLTPLTPVHLEPADVTDEAAVAAAFRGAAGALGPVSILINNAGAAESEPFATTSLTLWRRMLEVNLTGSFLCARAAVPAMVAAGWGRIVNLASIAGLEGFPYVSAYCAAKHGVIGLTRALAREVAKHHVTVNAVCPGYTDTDLLRQAVAAIAARTGRDESEARAELARQNPGGRLLTAREVALKTAWLCSPEADAITGQTITFTGSEEDHDADRRGP